MVVVRKGEPGEIYVIDEIMHVYADRKIRDGLMIEAARQDLLLHADKYIVTDNRVINADTGLAIEPDMDRLLASRPHWSPISYSDAEENTFGATGNLTKHGEYVKRFGQEKYDFEAARWGCSPTKLTGTRPAGGEDKRKMKPGVTLDQVGGNPFQYLRKADGSIDVRAQAAVVALIASPGGPTKAAALAKQAGVTLGGVPIRAR
jgi:hypothetical protein